MSRLLEDVTAELSKLPGIGRRTALRLAMHLLRMDVASVQDMTSSIDRFRTQIRHCKFCNNLSDTEICPICSDTIERACDAIVHQRYAYLCANDPEELEEFEALARRLQDAFQTMLPEKSSFEK